MWAVIVPPAVFRCTLKYSLGRPVASQCTLGQPVEFQWHSNVHWNSQCTPAQCKEYSSLVRNYRDVTIKHIHEKHTDVNRWVVALFKVTVSSTEGRDCFKVYAVLLIIQPWIWRPIFVEIDVNFCSSVNCQKISTRNECTVHRLRHRWHRLIK